MTTARVRPPCAVCAEPVDRIHDAVGAAIAYPCQHWHTPLQARSVRNTADRAADLDERPTP